MTLTMMFPLAVIGVLTGIGLARVSLKNDRKKYITENTRKSSVSTGMILAAVNLIILGISVLLFLVLSTPIIVPVIAFAAPLLSVASYAGIMRVILFFKRQPIHSSFCVSAVR